MFVLITGGSGSGKSAYAESRAVELICQVQGEEKGQLYYIATMYPYDAESYKRIDRHREMRKEKNFITVEQYTGLKELSFPANAVVLLECMSNLTANEIFQPQGAGEKTVDEIWAGIRKLKETCAHLIVVTNEIFSDGITYEQETLRYQQYLGTLNCLMAKEAEEVTEVVAGIVLQHKSPAEKCDTTEE